MLEQPKKKVICPSCKKEVDEEVITICALCGKPLCALCARSDMIDRRPVHDQCFFDGLKTSSDLKL